MRIAEPEARDFDAWVRRLSDPLRAPGAYRHLMSAGDGARAAVVRGLVSPNPDTRMHCARLLDHLVDESAYPSLIALLDAATADPAPAVRKRAGWYAPGGTIYTKTRPRHRRGAAMVE